MTERLNDKPSSRAFARMIVAIFSLLLFTACAAGGQDGPAEKRVGAELAVPVETVTAGQESSGGEIGVTGTLEAHNQTPVGAKEGGIVKAIFADVGSRVKKGQALAVFDLKDLTLGAELAEAAFRSAQVAAETAEKDYKRYQKLHEEGSATSADFDKFTLAYKTAGYTLTQAKAQFELARNRVTDATVRAPYDGQIIQRLVNLGSYVDAGSHPTLFVMVDLSRLKANLNLPEVRAVLVSPGDEVLIDLPSHERRLTAKIDVIADAVDPATHTRLAVAWIENKGATPLPSGIFFEARIKPKAMATKILIPAAAVRVEPGPKYSAYIVRNEKAALRELQGAFLPDHGDFLIKGGITAGERVITEASAVRDGQPVSLSGAAMQAKPSQSPPPAAAPKENRK